MYIIQYVVQGYFLTDDPKHYAIQTHALYISYFYIPEDCSF